MNPLIPILFMLSMALGISSCEKEIVPPSDQKQIVLPSDTVVNDFNLLLAGTWRWEMTDPKPAYVGTLAPKTPMIGEDDIWTFKNTSIFYVYLLADREVYYVHWAVDYINTTDSIKIAHVYMNGTKKTATYPWFISKSDTTLYLEEQFTYIKFRRVKE